MTLDSIRKFFIGLSGVSENIKWDSHLCFNVSGKIFLITPPDESPVKTSFRTSSEKFEELTERDGFRPALLPDIHRGQHLFHPGFCTGGVLNVYFVRSGITPGLWSGILLIQGILFGLIFPFQVRLTFWPPIIVAGLVFIFLVGAYLTN